MIKFIQDEECAVKLDEHTCNRAFEQILHTLPDYPSMHNTQLTHNAKNMPYLLIALRRRENKPCLKKVIFYDFTLTEAIQLAQAMQIKPVQIYQNMQYQQQVRIKHLCLESNKNFSFYGKTPFLASYTISEQLQGLVCVKALSLMDCPLDKLGYTTLSKCLSD